MASPVVDVLEERIVAVLRNIHLNLRKREYQRAMDSLERFIFELASIQLHDPISVLPLECQLVDKLEEEGNKTVRSLVKASYEDLINIRSFGPTKVNRFRAVLVELGLRPLF